MDNFDIQLCWLMGLDPDKVIRIKMQAWPDKIEVTITSLPGAYEPLGYKSFSMNRDIQKLDYRKLKRKDTKTWIISENNSAC